MSAVEPVVVVTRDPDSSNVIHVYGFEARVIDVDLGRAELSDPDEFAEWSESMHADIESLGAHPAADEIRETVVDLAMRYGHVMDEERWR